MKSIPGQCWLLEGKGRKKRKREIEDKEEERSERKVGDLMQSNAKDYLRKEIYLEKLSNHVIRIKFIGTIFFNQSDWFGT